MFERFTDRARSVVMLAQEEARELQHNYIGTEHLLLGLLREGQGVAAQALSSLISLDTARSEVERRVGRGSKEPQGHIPFTPRAKKVLELSLREALRLSHNYIGTEHVLLGLVREGEGVAAQVLTANIDGGLGKVRDSVVALMGTGAVEPLGQELGKAGRGLRARLGRLGSVQVVGMEDEVRKRLEAIEARLSAIEQLLRQQQGDEEEVS